VGIEADIEWSNASDAGRSFSVLGPPVGSGDVELNWQGSVRGRLGVASGTTLFYATAGVAFGNFDLGFTAIDHHSFSETLTGWTVGGGVETVIAGNWTGRIEYRFTDYGDTTKPFVLAPGTVHHQRHELESHALRMGLSHRF
jgi:outer membrane immunogenic protein